MKIKKLKKKHKRNWVGPAIPAGPPKPVIINRVRFSGTLNLSNWQKSRVKSCLRFWKKECRGKVFLSRHPWANVRAEKIGYAVSEPTKGEPWDVLLACPRKSEEKSKRDDKVWKMVRLARQRGIMRAVVEP